jgi:hypothetical protein
LLKGDWRERIDGLVPRNMAFSLPGYDTNKTIQVASDREAVNPLFTTADTDDSGADGCPAPEFGKPPSRKRVNRPARNLIGRRCCDSHYKFGVIRGRCIRRSQPMPNSFNAMTDGEAALKRNCVAQIIVSLSALASTAVLLAQELPQLLNGFP